MDQGGQVVSGEDDVFHNGDRLFIMIAFLILADTWLIRRQQSDIKFVDRFLY